jgi:hypothetical protein
MANIIQCKEQLPQILEALKSFTYESRHTGGVLKILFFIIRKTTLTENLQKAMKSKTAK